MSNARRSESNRFRSSATTAWLVAVLLPMTSLTMVQIAQAATLHVGTPGADLGNCTMPANPCATVSYAVSQASSGDTLMIAAGIYTESAGVDLDKSLSIQGAGVESTILQAHAEPAAASQRVITIDGAFVVDIAGLTIRNGVESVGLPIGGGLYANGATLALENVAFRTNQAALGGGLASLGSDLTLTGVRFEDNTSVNGDGGGMLIRNGTAVLTDVRFSGNTARRGGGLFALENTSTFIDVVFIENDANLEGGGLRNEAGPADLVNVSFTENSSLSGGGFFNLGDVELNTVSFTDNTGVFGGGMHHASGAVIAIDSTFSGNVVTRLGLGGGGMGGGLYVAAESVMQLERVAFTDNTGYQGGGMHNAGASPELVDVNFDANTADFGGGMFSSGGAATLTGGTFTHNRSVSDVGGGGGMMNYNGAATVLNGVEFQGNTANSGGGMVNTDSTTILEDVRFVENNAVDAGGGMYNGGGAPQLRGVDFIDNTTTGDTLGSSGAGLYNANSSPTLVDVEFVGNQAAGSGGGMYNFNNSMPQLTGVVFRNNVAVGNSGGGMGNIVGSSATLRNVLFENNSAQLVGGAIWSPGSHVELIDVAIVSNQSGSDGGGIHVREGSVALTNVTIYGNTAGTHGGGMNTEAGATITARNSIIWGNSANGAGEQILIAPDTSVSLFFSVYANGQNDVMDFGTLIVDNSLTQNPMFVDAPSGNVRLAEGSPAVNSGDPATDMSIFATDGNGDPIDIDGNPRLIGVAIDMGAYESAFEMLPQAGLAFDPGSLDFGEVGIGIASTVRTAILRNTGNAIATNLAFQLSEEVFVANTATCGGSLGIGAECEISITFTPDALGSHAGQFIATSDGGVSGDLNLEGSGIELPPHIDVDPDVVEITVPTGEAASQTLTINNLGQLPLEWTIATANPAGLLGGPPIDCEAAPGLISHDDGTIENGFPSIQTFMMVDHFMPASYPASLQSACLAFLSGGPTSLSFEIVVFADDGSNGQPGTQLGALPASAQNLPMFPPAPPALPSWYAFDISAMGISIDSSGVFIGVRWMQMSEDVLLGIDTSPANPPGFAGGYTWEPSAQQWMPTTMFIPNYRSLFVRAIAATGSACSDLMDVDWLDIDPVSGTTEGGAGSEVGLHFDSHGLAPGNYETLLCIASNDPARPATTVPITMTVGDPVPRSVTVISGSGQTVVVNAPFSLPLAVQVRDGSGRPLANVAVQFAAPPGGASAMLSTLLATTDANGYAAVTAIANGTAGDYAVTASVMGVAEAADFQLSNKAAVSDISVAIISDDEYVQRGRLVDYLIRIDNNGATIANGVDIATALATQLDVSFAHWMCVGPAGSGCTTEGQGELVDGGLSIAAGGSVMYALTAPVRIDADGTLDTSVDVAYDDDPIPDNDTASATSEVVIHRDGFEMYGDGSQQRVAHDDVFETGKRLLLQVPAPSDALIDTLLEARSATGEGGFRVERMNIAAGQWLRIVVIADGAEHASAWTPVPVGVDVIVSLLQSSSNDEAESWLSLSGAGFELRLPLPATQPHAYRLAAVGTIAIEEEASGP